MQFKMLALELCRPNCYLRYRIQVVRDSIEKQKHHVIWCPGLVIFKMLLFDWL